MRRFIFCGCASACFRHHTNTFLPQVYTASKRRCVPSHERNGENERTKKIFSFVSLAPLQFRAFRSYVVFLFLILTHKNVFRTFCRDELVSYCTKVYLYHRLLKFCMNSHTNANLKNTQCVK